VLEEFNIVAENFLAKVARERLPLRMNSGLVDMKAHLVLELLEADGANDRCTVLGRLRLLLGFFHFLSSFVRFWLTAAFFLGRGRLISLTVVLVDNIRLRLYFIQALLDLCLERLGLEVLQLLVEGLPPTQLSLAVIS